MLTLDPTNMRILEILQHDARTSIADIGRMVNRAESTVRERVASLESNGVIRGYHARVDPHAVGLRTQAIVRADPDLADLGQLAERLRAVPQVTRAVLTTGENSLRVEVLAEDMPSLERVLVERLAPLGLERVETAVVVRPLVEPRPVPAPGRDAENGARPLAVPPLRHPSGNGRTPVRSASAGRFTA